MSKTTPRRRPAPATTGGGHGVAAHVRGVVPCAALAAVLAASGCGSASNTSTASTGAPSPAASVKTTPLPAPASFSGKSVGAASDVTIDKCPTDAGSQVASGTVKNSSKTARDYAIIIMWLRNNDGKPYGSGITTVKSLAPGKTANWKVSAVVATKVDSCVKNVYAGTLGTKK